MIDLAATIAAMRAAGMDDTTVLNALACVRLVRADNDAVPPDSPPDTAADKRRAYDRDRKAKMRAEARARALASTGGQADGQEVPAESPPDTGTTPAPASAPLVPPLSPAPLTPPIIPPPPPPPPGDEPEPPVKTRKGTRLPEDFIPDSSCEATARELKFSNGDWKRALQEFRDYWAGVPGQKGTKLDWQATFRNSLRRYAERKTYGKPANQAAMEAAFDNLEGKISQHRHPDDGPEGPQPPDPSGLAY